MPVMNPLLRWSPAVSVPGRLELPEMSSRQFLISSVNGRRFTGTVGDLTVTYLLAYCQTRSLMRWHLM